MQKQGHGMLKNVLSNVYTFECNRKCLKYSLTLTSLADLMVLE